MVNCSLFSSYNFCMSTLIFCSFSIMSSSRFLCYDYTPSKSPSPCPIPLAILPSPSPLWQYVLQTARFQNQISHIQIHNCHSLKQLCCLIHLHYFYNYLFHKLWCTCLCHRIFGSFYKRS